jgi:hypothetical protein
MWSIYIKRAPIMKNTFKTEKRYVYLFLQNKTQTNAESIILFCYNLSYKMIIEMLLHSMPILRIMQFTCKEIIISYKLKNILAFKLTRFWDKETAWFFTIKQGLHFIRTQYYCCIYLFTIQNLFWNYQLNLNPKYLKSIY